MAGAPALAGPLPLLSVCVALSAQVGDLVSVVTAIGTVVLLLARGQANLTASFSSRTVRRPWAGTKRRLADNVGRVSAPHKRLSVPVVGFPLLALKVNRGPFAVNVRTSKPFGTVACVTTVSLELLLRPACLAGLLSLIRRDTVETTKGLELRTDTAERLLVQTLRVSVHVPSRTSP